MSTFIGLKCGVADKVIQTILVHSNVNVTVGYYRKLQTPDVVAAMGKFDAEMATHSFRDSNGTVNRNLGCNAQIRKPTTWKEFSQSRRADLNR